MIRTKKTGNGTVIQTTYEELATPLNIQKKTITQTEKVEANAVPEKVVGSPSAYSLQFESTDRITLTLKNCSALDTSFSSHVQNLPSRSFDQGRGF